MNSQWIKPCFYAFMAGALLVGPLDFFHSITGIQTYLVCNYFAFTRANWPWYLPFQMGTIGLVMVIGWTWYRRLVLNRLIPQDAVRILSNDIWIPPALAMVIGGYVLAWALVDSAHYTAWFVLLFLVLLILVIMFGSQQQILAFVMTALIGICAEWFLLDPEIGYYEFTQKDWFGRSSSWLLVTYGGVGIFIHQMSQMIDRPSH